MMTIESAIVGTQHQKGVFAAMFAADPGSLVDLVREPDNPYDPNAVAVHVEGVKCGYVPRAQAKRLAADMDVGRKVTATLTGKKLEIEIGAAR